MQFMDKYEKWLSFTELNPATFQWREMKILMFIRKKILQTPNIVKKDISFHPFNTVSHRA